MGTTATTRIDLLLLGLLLDRSMHGYELFQQIHAEAIDTWFDVSQAGVYYSLAKLRDRGWVSESRQRSQRSAGRSVYSLTDAGRAAFFSAMEEQALSPEPVYLPYDPVIYLLNRLTLSRATELLERRIAWLEEQKRSIEATLSEETAAGGAATRLAVLDHRRRFLEMERTWLAGLIRDEEGAPRARGAGLMVLRGDLCHFHLPDLVRLIALGGHSGTLSVTDGLDVRMVGFRAGQPCCAGLLRNQGSADPASAERILAGLHDLFRWGEGRFTFDQGLGCPEGGVPLTCSADELILAGCRWVDRWSIIQRLVPSSESVFEMCAPAGRLEALSLTDLEGKVLNAVDGSRDVEAVARLLGLTVFEVSRALYALAAAGLVRSADLDKIRLRRVFREIAELMCASTVAWRSSVDDRTCEEEVNQLCSHLPLHLSRGRIEDQAEPQLRTDEVVELYRSFLLAQLDVVSRRFGCDGARESYQRTLRQLAPELQEVAHRYGFDRML